MTLSSSLPGFLLFPTWLSPSGCKDEAFGSQKNGPFIIHRAFQCEFLETQSAHDYVIKARYHLLQGHTPRRAPQL